MSLLSPQLELDLRFANQNCKVDGKMAYNRCRHGRLLCGTLRHALRSESGFFRTASILPTANHFLDVCRTPCSCRPVWAYPLGIPRFSGSSQTSQSRHLVCSQSRWPGSRSLVWQSLCWKLKDLDSE